MPFDEFTGWKRQLWRVVLLLSMIAVLYGTVMTELSRVDRGELREAQAKLEQQQLLLEATIKNINDAKAHDDKMLAARARCQINLFNAVRDGRKFNQTELDEIEQLWMDARYDAIQNKFLNPTKFNE